MDKEFCRQIDDEDLVEKYIAGKLHGELLSRLLAHLSECSTHSEAVNLERILSRGVRDFARTELKAKLRSQIKLREISKYYILRYAAILIVAIMAPIILYYQVLKMPSEPAPVAEPVPAETSTEKITKSSPEQADETIPKASPQTTSEPSEVRYEVSRPAAATSAKRAAEQPVSSQRLSTPAGTDMQKEQIFNLLNENEGKISDCIMIPDIMESQQVTLEFILQVNGSVTGLKIEPQKLFSEKNKQCVADILNRLQFPVPQTPQKIIKNIQLHKTAD